MSSTARLGLGVAAASLLAVPAVAQQRPAARPLGRVMATSAEALGALSTVRQLPGGLVLVNDPVKRRVLLMDSTLTVRAVVADTLSATSNYGPRAGGLLPFRGDSTLFVDPTSLSMLVIDPAGRITRVMAAPRPDDVMFLVGGPLGNPAFDAQGRLVYRTMNRMMRPAGPPPAPGQPFTPPTPPDSAPVIRFDLATRKLDTASFIKTPKVNMTIRQTENGMSVSTTINPLPILDDWAVLPDGTIAFVRGRDYHVDFVNPDGSMTNGPKIPFDWQRLSDSAKTFILDSAKTAANARRSVTQTTGGVGAAAGAAAAAAGGAGGGATTVVMSMGAGGADRVVTSAGPGSAASIEMVPESELPDYRPAFAGGSTRADAEGRLWIRTIPTKPLTGGPEYDVVDRTGKLVERVAIPAGTTIVGFGAGGNVYLGVRDASGTRVVRVKRS